MKVDEWNAIVDDLCVLRDEMFEMVNAAQGELQDFETLVNNDALGVHVDSADVFVFPSDDKIMRIGLRRLKRPESEKTLQNTSNRKWCVVGRLKNRTGGEVEEVQWQGLQAYQKVVLAQMLPSLLRAIASLRRAHLYAAQEAVKEGGVNG